MNGQKPLVAPWEYFFILINLSWIQIRSVIYVIPSPPQKDVIANKRCSIVYEIRTLCQCSYFWATFYSQIVQRQVVRSL